MENTQQPGKVYSPNSSAPKPEKTSASDEINQIDAAMEQAPQDQDQPAPPEPARATTESDPASDPQPAAEPVNQPDQDQLSPLPSEPDVSSPETPSYMSQPDAEGAKDYEPIQEPLLTWQAAEPQEASRQSQKLMMLLSVAAVIAGIAILVIGGVNFSTVLSAVVVAAAVAAVVASTRRSNHLESYQVYEGGVMVGNRYYAFDQLQSYSLVKYGNAVSVELTPVKRFMMRVVVHLDNSTYEEAIKLLSQNLPFEERNLSVLDRLSNSLKL